MRHFKANFQMLENPSIKKNKKKQKKLSNTSPKLTKRQNNPMTKRENETENS